MVLQKIEIARHNRIQQMNLGGARFSKPQDPPTTRLSRVSAAAPPLICSLLLFGDHIAPIGWAGIAVIVTSGILATILRTRAIPNPPAEGH